MRSHGWSEEERGVVGGAGLIRPPFKHGMILSNLERMDSDSKVQKPKKTKVNPQREGAVSLTVVLKGRFCRTAPAEGRGTAAANPTGCFHLYTCRMLSIMCCGNKLKFECSSAGVGEWGGFTRETGMPVKQLTRVAGKIQALHRR